jgi:hypothetical protein
MSNNSTGITYRTTGTRSRGRISSYHCKPSPIELHKTPHQVDVAGLKPKQKREAIKFDGMEYVSKFTIGFEVEKSQLHSSAVREYPLFCGFEHDSSCGYEAVTNILPLLPAGMWRNKVFNMMYQAEKIIDDQYSPSNGTNSDGAYRCGGHVTIGVDGMDGEQVLAAVRKNCGILMAIFRKRLLNHFCGGNLRMLPESLMHRWNHGDGVIYDTCDLNWDSNNVRSCGWVRKYNMANVKGNTLEFRLVSRFQSVKQMMRRYQLFYEIVDFSINQPNGRHDSLLKRIRPIILSMYDGNETTTDEVMGLASLFRAYIINGVAHERLERFLPRLSRRAVR